MGEDEALQQLESEPTNQVEDAAEAPQPLKNGSQNGAFVVKKSLESRVADTTKYPMWTINERTNEHELDPGPLTADFYCNGCNVSLPVGTVRIRCADCVDHDLCVACACKGYSTESHNPSHRYMPIGPNTFDLFTAGWTADEEVMLLEGISKYGFGNWNQVAEMVNRVKNKTKSPMECESHYNEVYIGSKTSPYPNVEKLQTPVANEVAGKDLHDFMELLLSVHKRAELDTKDAKIVSFEERRSHSEFIPEPRRIVVTSEKQKFFQNFAGYNIHRLELENEHQNDAEFILKDVEFDPTDSPAEIDFKIGLVDLYNCMLDERIHRKRILMDRFWNEYAARDAAMQQMSEAEKVVYWRMSPLARFQSEAQHINMTKLLVAKAELERRLDVVQIWNSLGLETKADVESFDRLKLQINQARPNVKGLQNLTPFTTSLLTNGTCAQQELANHQDAVTSAFCKELQISRATLDDLMQQVIAGFGTSNPQHDDTCSTIPTWDLLVSTGQAQQQLKQPTQPLTPPNILMPNLDCLKNSGYEARIILTEPNSSNEFDATGIDFTLLKIRQHNANTTVDMSRQPRPSGIGTATSARVGNNQANCYRHPNTHSNHAGARANLNGPVRAPNGIFQSSVLTDFQNKVHAYVVRCCNDKRVLKNLHKRRRTVDPILTAVQKQARTAQRRI